MYLERVTGNLPIMQMCLLEPSQFRQKQSLQLIFIAAQCSSKSQYALYKWRIFYMIWVS